MKNTKSFLFGCCFAVAAAVVACGTAGNTGDPGSAGASGAQGAQGAAGANGASGAQGAQGAAGAAGEQGAAGSNGPIACGQTLIQQADWHSACGAVASDPSGVTTSCTSGVVECRLTDVDDELVPQVFCWDTVSNRPAMMSDAERASFPNNPALSPDGASGRCDLDTACSGNADSTAGVGQNVALVRDALTFVCPIVDSQKNLCQQNTLLPGLCRNATKHCLAGNQVAALTQTSDAGLSSVRVTCDGFGHPLTTEVTGVEGVTLSDFGANNEGFFTPTADEQKMAYECVDSAGSVRVWACSVDATTGVASVTCSGPAQP